jgi:succinate dehydrogenase / fumarate reductase membrane anchor subunit
MSSTKKTTTAFHSPLSVARGAGSTHSGVHHWMHQRVTGFANIGLMIWLVWSVTHMSVVDYATFTAWLAQPINAVLMILAIISTFYHASLGAQVVVEDYVHNEGFKLVKLAAMKSFFLAAAIACIFSILKIAFAG